MLVTLVSQDSIDRFLKFMFVNGASRNTLRAYRSDMKGLLKSLNSTDSSTTPELIQSQFASLMNLTPVSSAQGVMTEIEYSIAEYLTAHRETWQANTLNRKLACFRRYGKFLGYDRFLENYSKMPTPPPFPHPIAEGMDGVLAMARGARTPTHAAMVILTGMLGLRMHEALTIRPTHIKDDTEPMSLRFMGKGEKVRDVPVHNTPYSLLLPRLIHCWSTDCVLIPIDDRAARRAINRIGVRVLGHHVASHDLRMTYGTTAYYQSGGDLRAVQELLGHADSHTTENYTHVTMEKKAAASDFYGEEE